MEIYFITTSYSAQIYFIITSYMKYGWIWWRILDTGLDDINIINAKLKLFRQALGILDFEY